MARLPALLAASLALLAAPGARAWVAPAPAALARPAARAAAARLHAEPVYYGTSYADAVAASGGGGAQPCVIKAIGVGGGGGNAVNRMVAVGVEVPLASRRLLVAPLMADPLSSPGRRLLDDQHGRPGAW
jgi:uncharacterized membrane protein